MDPRSQEVLNQILAKNPAQLTETEIGFLRARQSYLKSYQLKEYQSILQPVVNKNVVSYNDLLQQAKALGYNGPRMSRGKLEAFIKEHTVVNEVTPDTNESETN